MPRVIQMIHGSDEDQKSISHSPKLHESSKKGKRYTFSHNQSCKWNITLNERKLILEGAIFHFHDYGRKPIRVQMVQMNPNE